MAGRGSRFATAGYKSPKPLIPVHGVPMIKAVVRNLTPVKKVSGTLEASKNVKEGTMLESSRHLFQHISCHYTFIVLQEHIEQYAVDRELQKLVPGSSVVVVDRVTEGAACTVLLARDLIDNEHPLMLANSDQFVEIDINRYLAVQEEQNLDGLIMTFRNDHPKWSYCRMGQGGLVTEVLEKQVVSNEATVGIYNFRRGRDFVRAADKMITQDKRVNGEFYVAPVYNELIAEGGRVGIFNIGEEGQQMHGLGVPEDLEAFLALSKYKTLFESWH